MFTHAKHVVYPLLLLVGLISSAQAMTVSGPITASAVSVSGDVTISSMTVSTLTVSGQLNVGGAITPSFGRILQTTFTYTTVATTTSVSTPSWADVQGMAPSITLSNANDLVRISVSGSLYDEITSTTTTTDYGFLTVYRDTTTNLGNQFEGIASDNSLRNQSGITGFVASSPVGITIVDKPGDTRSHTYKVRITDNGAGFVSFPDESVGYILLEEIGQ
jgi:hypothetical protein